MYTKNFYKQEIQRFISAHGYDAALIAKNTYEIFMEHIEELDSELRENLLDIANMEMGIEFEMTENEFDDYLNKM